MRVVGETVAWRGGGRQEFMRMQKIDPQQYQKRLDHITELVTAMVVHADELSKRRCPYKNRLNQCSALVGCRNKTKPVEAGGPPICAGDDKLDYRGAWET